MHNLRNHLDNGATPMAGVDTTAHNRGRNAIFNLDVGALVIASLRNLDRRYRGRLNIRLLCVDMCSRNAGLSSLLDYERAVVNAIADLEKQGCVRTIGGLWKGAEANMNARVSLTNLMR